MSLRERKKVAAREALSWAALRLATERGLEHVRVEDIATEAGVSARTFNNYFSSKEEAICAIGVDRQLRIRDAILARPAEEPLWEAVTNAVLEQYSGPGEPDREHLARVRLVMTSPALRGEYLKTHVAVETALAQGIAERIGADAGRDLYPRLMAAVVGGAVRVAIGHWMCAGRAEPFLPTLADALNQVAAGMPDLSSDSRKP
ncbi:TetR family transcriptional regulator [Amycolatopsis nigrescens]|uniref:acyl-CoA-like ligand-binding transcription factor n=1 Tax=Amycolatopsis nigrescens TaxID=381445 RepID=UPI00036CFD31|nr:TetR family transcriptional regulator [Amycolatopsis nigrescens]